jgi:hypothetical protein
VAAQIERFGLPGLLVQIEDNVGLLGRPAQQPAPSSNPARHPGLSFDLLSPCEQICLRRLAVFVAASASPARRQ